MFKKSVRKLLEKSESSLVRTIQTYLADWITLSQFIWNRIFCGIYPSNENLSNPVCKSMYLYVISKCMMIYLVCIWIRYECVLISNEHLEAIYLKIWINLFHKEHFVKHMYAQSDLTYPKKQLRGNPTCTNGTALTDYFNSAAVKDRLKNFLTIKMSQKYFEWST